MRRKLWSAVAAALLVLGAFFLILRREPAPPVSAIEKKRVEGARLEVAGPEEGMPEGRMLAFWDGYGSAETTEREDMAIVGASLQRFWLLLKNPDLLRVGSNQEILAGLSGGNPEGMAFAPAEGPYVDASGQLLDRWGRPLFFHALSLTHIEIRSAGADGVFYTADDVTHSARSPLPLR